MLAVSRHAFERQWWSVCIVRMFNERQKLVPSIVDRRCPSPGKCSLFLFFYPPEEHQPIEHYELLQRSANVGRPYCGVADNSVRCCYRIGALFEAAATASEQDRAAAVETPKSAGIFRSAVPTATKQPRQAGGISPTHHQVAVVYIRRARCASSSINKREHARAAISAFRPLNIALRPRFWT